MELKGIDFLKKKLSIKQVRVDTRYKYYEMKNIPIDFKISTPPDLKHWFSTLGWCAKAVDSLADRLQFREFAKDNFDMNTIFNMNNPDILFDSAILGALIGSCSFIYISKDADGFPRLQVIDGYNATGIIDPFTNMLTEGYAILSRDSNGNPVTEAYFTPNNTVYYQKGKIIRVDKNDAPYALLVPIIYKPDAKRPFGHSRISRACMSIVGSALRTIKRSEIAAEFYSFPQKYVTGLANDAEIENWKASMSSMITFTKDEDGDHPVVGQFQQESMQPHIEQLRMFASLFAGETGLTLDDLGFTTENPASAEAIKATHENLRLTARKAQRVFGSAFLNVGYLAACVRDEYEYSRSQIYVTTPKWQPIFEPDSSVLSAIGDGIIKINQAVPEYLNKDNLFDLIGIGNE
ncbi:MAG: phage portal protein [Bacteroidales bacterium]|nr:phage portal protein [Candidatus Scybalousia scybalohippi]